MLRNKRIGINDSYLTEIIVSHVVSILSVLGISTVYYATRIEKHEG